MTPNATTPPRPDLDGRILWDVAYTDRGWIVELGLCAPNNSTLEMGVLKNRGGRAGYVEHLPFRPERGRIG